MKAFSLYKENRTLIKKRKLSYVGTAEMNVKFASSLKPLFHSKAKYEVIDMKMTF